MNEDIQKRIAFLEKEIRKHNDIYWNNSKEYGEDEAISDEDYDLLVIELEQLDPDNELVNQVFEQFVSSTEDVKHEVPMLSLDKIYIKQKLFDWVNKKARCEDELFLIQPKYDGISSHLQNNVLSTRGDGVIGKNISDKLSIINIESMKKTFDDLLGEIVIRKDDFENIFSKIVSPSTKKCYKNHRNATAGIMGTDDITFFQKQGAKLTLVDYDLFSFKVKKSNFEDEWEEIVERISSLPYPMDGIVIKLEDQEYGKTLGVTAHHPKNAIAFKFGNPKKETKIVDIEWSFGKNNLTPVAILSPVDINGITIGRASLSNYENVLRLELMIGDTVIVERAGDVIPHIIGVHKNINELERKNPFITNCPCCNTELKVYLPEIVCPSEDCIEKILRRLLFSIRSIGVEKVGIPTLKKIISNSNVRNLMDFVNLKIDDLISFGFGDKTSENIIEEIKKHKSIEEYEFLTALNIQDVGFEVAKLILSKYSTEDLCVGVQESDFIKIKGIGDVTAKKIINYFNNNKNYVIELKKLFMVKQKEINNNDKVCFTGAMDLPRKHYEDIAVKKNLNPVSSVTSDLKYLVVADVNSNSSKTQKAKKYGVSIISVEDFLKIEGI